MAAMTSRNATDLVSTRLPLTPCTRPHPALEGYDTWTAIMESTNMSDTSDATYQQRTYGAREIGYGRKPGIAVVDFQLAFTDPTFPLGGAPMIERAVNNTAHLLSVARRCGVPIASCYTAYTSKEDMPYWKIGALEEQLIHGHRATELDPRIYDPAYDVRLCKTGASIFFQTPIVAFMVRQQVDTMIIVGCVTSGCVRASIVDSFQNGFRTIVPEDAVGDQDERPHHDNLRDVGRRYCDITNTGSVIAWIEAWHARNEPLSKIPNVRAKASS
jgi:maleamate amidohydrolase